MCHLYVKVSQTLVDQMMDSFFWPMLEQIVNTTTTTSDYFWEGAVTFGTLRYCLNLNQCRAPASVCDAG